MAGDAALRALAAACPATRSAGAGDAVAGVTPRYAASPASVAEASAVMRAADERGLAVVARGSGSRLDWGTPPRRCELVIDTLLLDQVVEHAAGDLVARVQAGVGLRRLGEVLAAAGQQLALDVPPGRAAPDGQEAVDTATVGGTLATGAAGPRRLRYGTPRDLIIGITVVRADGTVASSGGKVVKNVAGYDLGRLFTGSFGTLGLIVEAVFRLHPLPASAAYITVDCPGPDEAYRAVAAAAGGAWHRRPSRSTARRTGSRCGWPCCWKATRTAPQSAPGRCAPCSVRGRPRSRRRPRGGAGKLAATGGPARTGRALRRGSPAARSSRDRPGR